MSRARQDEDALFPDPAAPRKRGGPVYQGVARQIRHLFPKDDQDAQARREQLAGTVSQALSLAASIDRVSGHDGSTQANGVPLAAMHAQLDAILDRLAGTGTTDAFQELLNELNGQGVPGDRQAQEPHAAE